MGADTANRLYAIAGASDCDHPGVRELGADGGANRYYRCSECGSVLVREGGPTPTGGTDDLGTVDPRMDDLLADLEAYHDGRESSFAPDRSTSLVGSLRDLWRRLLP